MPIVAPIVLGLAVGGSVAVVESEQFRIGPYRATLAELAAPSDAAIAPDGSLWVVEADAHRLSHFDAEGQRLGTVGGPGGGPGQFLAPKGIAIEPGHGTIYVSDTGNHRIQVLDRHGTHLRSIGGYGDELGRFNEPRGLALGGGLLYVADLGNHRVQAFDADGVPVNAFGGFGSGAGQFSRPIDVAVADDGAVFVADADNSRICRFRDGAFEKAWGDYGPFVGLMDEPSALAWTGERLFVVDRRNHRIQVFDADGELDHQWGRHAILLHEGDGALHYPDALAIAPDGSYAAVVESFENRGQLFAALPAGADLIDEALPVAQKGKQSHFGERLSVDGRLLALTEPEGHRVHLFDTSKDIPIVIGNFGERGPRSGQFVRLEGVSLDADARRLLTTDSATRKLQSLVIEWSPDEMLGFSPTRMALGTSRDLEYFTAALAEASEAAELRWILEPRALRRGTDGNLYILDPRNSSVLVFDPEFRFLRAWGGFGSEPGQFRGPTDFAFSQDGTTLFVVDADNHRVQAFDRVGNFLLAFGGTGDAEGAFVRPFGIAAGRDGFVYVSDPALGRVSKFTEEGAFVLAFGRTGIEDGELWHPKGIAQDERQRLIVVDEGNHRAQIFSPLGDWLVTFGLGRARTKWDEERRAEWQRQLEERQRQRREQQQQGGGGGS